MKILLACNDTSKDKLSALISGQFNDAHVTAVCNKAAYDNLNFKKEAFEQAFFYVELDWLKDNTSNQGYELAVDFMNQMPNSKRLIQIRFLSLKKQVDLIKKVRGGDKFFLAKSFQHIYDVGLKRLSLEYYSKEHYEFIKLFSLKKSGILLFVKHELDTIQRNLLEEEAAFSSKKTLIKKHVDSLAFLGNELFAIDSNILAMNKDEINAFLTAILKNIERLIHKDSGKIITEKLKYNVLIVEDDQEMLLELVEICKERFISVYPSSDTELKNYSIEKAYEQLKEKGNNFQVMILDLLFERADESYEMKSGVDFLKMASVKHPYLTTRIITNVSRQIISAILKISLKDLYPKNMGKEALREFIINDIDRIKEECLEKANSKRIRCFGPKMGFFEIPEVWNQVQNLIESDEFEYFWNNSALKGLNNFNIYNKIVGFTGTLIKTEDKKRKVFTIDKIEAYLRDICIFRLLLLSKYIDHTISDGNFDHDIFETDVLNKICKRKFNTNFLNGIGIHATFNKIDAIYKIQLKNLFPQEVRWIYSALNNNPNNVILVADNYEDLAEWYEFFKNVPHFKAMGINIPKLDKDAIDFYHLNKLLEEISDSKNLTEDIAREIYNQFIEEHGIIVDYLPEDTQLICKRIFSKIQD
ncbi:hypothetical protein EGI22_16010 [Lacihabitans sp. LS3-19]|uniref:hypothetical protein n=1 Tax=Lacihabitans sp. LS3-19 TaxID=2487335 RepID=UPI0020CB9D8F|nr:hypothetical protein [Lacihabitans sp. LS3-19]MCP9769408.1 hypothetical protein [Lacihabitans sp. LS3-19]